MMDRLRSLLKAMMSGGLQLFNYQVKSEGAKRMMPLFLGALIGLIVLLDAATMTAELAKDGAQSVILSLYTLVAAVIIVMEGSYKASDLLFKPRDNDMLLAMPIKKSTIVFARMIKFYLFEAAYCLIFLLPAIIAYAMNAEVGVSFWVIAVTMMVIVPVIPIAAACIIGMIISALSGRFKHRAFWQVALSFAAMFAITGLVFMMNTTSDFGERGMAMIGDAATRFYYPAAVFVDLAEHFDMWEYLLFVLVNTIVMVLAVLVISRFCSRIITKLGEVGQIEVASAEYAFRKRSQTFAMIRKEITKYFNTPVLLVNTAMGLVFFAIAVGLLCLKFDEFADTLMSSVEDFPLTIDEMRALMPSVAFAMTAFASLMTCITATSISLEGKALNVLKALPIGGRKVLMAKVLAATLLIVPVTLFGWLVMCCRFQFGVLDAVLVLIGVVVMPLVTELIGILINLKYPRFDADNDTVVVKQSASVMMATFLGLIMMFATVFLTLVMVLWVGQTAGLAIVDGAYVVLTLLLYFMVMTRGDKKYLELVV